MKSLRTSLSVAILMSLAAVAFGQSERAKVLQQTKTLAGSWEGTVDGKSSQGQVTMRVTRMGNTLMHEMKSSDRPDDPISMFDLDRDRRLMTHHCNAGNQPRM